MGSRGSLEDGIPGLGSIRGSDGSPPHSGEADLLRAARLGAAGFGRFPGGSPGFVESRDR